MRSSMHPVPPLAYSQPQQAARTSQQQQQQQDGRPGGVKNKLNPGSELGKRRDPRSLGHAFKDRRPPLPQYQPKSTRNSMGSDISVPGRHPAFERHDIAPQLQVLNIPIDGLRTMTSSIRRSRVTKADRAMMEQEKQERDKMAGTTAAKQQPPEATSTSAKSMGKFNQHLTKMPTVPQFYTPYPQTPTHIRNPQQIIKDRRRRGQANAQAQAMAQAQAQAQAHAHQAISFEQRRQQRAMERQLAKSPPSHPFMQKHILDVILDNPPRSDRHGPGGLLGSASGGNGNAPMPDAFGFEPASSYLDPTILPNQNGNNPLFAEQSNNPFIFKQSNNPFHQPPPNQAATYSQQMVAPVKGGLGKPSPLPPGEVDALENFDFDSFLDVGGDDHAGSNSLGGGVPDGDALSVSSGEIDLTEKSRTHISQLVPLGIGPNVLDPSKERESFRWKYEKNESHFCHMSHTISQDMTTGMRVRQKARLVAVQDRGKLHPAKLQTPFDPPPRKIRSSNVDFSKKSTSFLRSANLVSMPLGFCILLVCIASHIRNILFKLIHNVQSLFNMHVSKILLPIPR